MIKSSYSKPLLSQGVADNISRWRCDRAFRQDTLATCKAQYMTPNIPSPSLIHIFNVDKTETDSHQTHFLRVVELHGMETFQDVLQGEVSALVKVHPAPSFQQFQAWFSRHKVHVRMLAEWVKHLAQYIQPQDMKETWNRKMSSLSQHASGHFQPLHGAGDSDEIDWCGDIDRYLKANNETMPSSSGLLCPDIQYLTCNFFSEIYFLAVWIFGGSGYRQQAEFYCHESWVTKCLPMPPSAVLRFLPHD